MKIKCSLLLVLLFPLFALAQNDSIEYELAENESFIILNNTFIIIIESMPTPDTFIQQFDSASFVPPGSQYLPQVTGFTQNKINLYNNILQSNIESIESAFPQFQSMSLSEIQHIFQRAAEILNDQNPPQTPGEQGILNPCDDCKRSGRISMSVGIAIGVIGCPGLMGKWACATLGFWVAADQTLTCIKTHCQ